jgi:hypothetical protein
MSVLFEIKEFQIEIHGVIWSHALSNGKNIQLLVNSENEEKATLFLKISYD